MASYLLISFLFIFSCADSQSGNVFGAVRKVSPTCTSFPDEWDKMQDSLRNRILENKPNQIVKNSLFQEFYIRGIAQPTTHNLVIKIPFNVHSNDCGAPDCYTTEVEFQFSYQDTIVLPPSFKLNEHETGCVNQKTQLTGTFEQVLHQANCVIYYCQKYKRAFALIQLPSSHPQGGWNNARYFTNVDVGDISAQMALNPDVVFESNEDKYPYSSWTLNTPEYSVFIH